jgi:hypothetical protein
MSEAVETTETVTTEAPTMDLVEAAKLVFGEEPAPEAGSADVSTQPKDAPPSEQAEAQTPAEPAAEAPVDDKVAKRIAVAKRAEMAAAEARREIRAKEEALAQEKAALEAEKARFRLLEEDPVKAFEVLKLDPKTFLEKLSGEYKPESVIERQLAAVRAELAALKETTQKEQETAKERAAREAVEQTTRAAASTFVQFVGESAEKFPHLVAEFTEDEAVNEAFRALHEVVGHDERGRPVTRNEAYFNQFGVYPDNDVIAEHLDTVAKQRSEARQNSAWAKRGQSPTAGSQPLSHGDPNPKAPPVIKGSSPRTLTSRAASEKASPPKQWSQEAADEESLRILQSAFRD